MARRNKISPRRVRRYLAKHLRYMVKDARNQSAAHEKRMQRRKWGDRL